MSGHTPGPWDHACDSSARVRHSRKACVFAVQRENGAERLVDIAKQIPNWEDARLIAAAPELLESLRDLVDQITRYINDDKTELPDVTRAREAIAKATDC